MIQKLLRVTFEISLLFIIGTLLSVVAELYLSDVAIKVLFTVLYVFLGILLFFTLPLMEPNKKISSILLNLMWVGILGIPVYQLLYSTAGGGISLEDITVLTVVGVFVFAYCTIFKNSQSGFTSLFVDNAFKRYIFAYMSMKEFFLLIYITALIAGWILLSSYLIKWIFLTGIQ